MTRPLPGTTAGYDVVVVGAGTAGCAVAARLAADPHCRVLLLEAGGSDRRPEVRLPAAFPLALLTGASAREVTVPQPGLGGRRVPLRRGRVLGGSSSVNAMIHREPVRDDVEAWRAAGAIGFGWEELRGFVAASASPEPLRDPHALPRTFVAAARTVPSVREAGLHPVSQRRGRRWSAADAHLRRADRLTVVTGAEVLRVVFRGTRAVGVDYRHGHRVHRVRADAEVVLCAGALRTPVLLQRSGIGPADVLTGAGVAPLADLPVGVGLQDHPLVVSTWSLRAGVPGLHSALAAPWRWVRHRRGLLTSNGTEAGAAAASDPDLSVPDLYLHAAPAALLGRTPGAAATRGFTIVTALLAPRSRGRITLGSAGRPPSIDPGYLTDDRDVDALVTGVRLADAIAHEPPLAGLLATRRRPRTAPGDDVAVRARVRRDTASLYHPTSGCALGSVVDDDHRVLGVAGLRVADASTLPGAPRTHPQALVTALAARAADRITDGSASRPAG